MEQFEVLENQVDGRFELRRDGDLVSFASYSQQDDVVVVPHVETSPQHRGNGYAARLMEGLLAIIGTDGRSIRPLCPFAAQHLSDNPQHQALVA